MISARWSPDLGVMTQDGVVRRQFMKAMGAASLGAIVGSARAAVPKPNEDARKEATMKRIQAGVLEIAYLESGSAAGPPVVLLHGFPYDVHSYDVAAAKLVVAGYRVIGPYLRGYGQTRFLRADTPRVGQQAALGSDLLALLDALSIRRATLAGYDWGGRAACVVAHTDTTLTRVNPSRLAQLLFLNNLLVIF